MRRAERLQLRLLFLEVGGRVEPDGEGVLAFTFVVVFALPLVVLGLLFGKSHGDGGAALVVTQAQAQGAIANPFAVQGQGAGKGAEVRPGAND